MARSLLCFADWRDTTRESENGGIDGEGRTEVKI